MYLFGDLIWVSMWIILLFSWFQLFLLWSATMTRKSNLNFILYCNLWMSSLEVKMLLLKVRLVYRVLLIATSAWAMSHMNCMPPLPRLSGCPAHTVTEPKLGDREGQRWFSTAQGRRGNCPHLTGRLTLPRAEQSGGLCSLAVQCSVWRLPNDPFQMVWPGNPFVQLSIQPCVLLTLCCDRQCAAYAGFDHVSKKKSFTSAMNLQEYWRKHQNTRNIFN